MVRPLLPSGAIGVRVSAPESADRAWVLGISLATLGAFFSLLVFRGIDDNRLTSWEWVFSGTDAARVAGLLVGGLIVAYGLSRVSVPGRYAAPGLFLSSFGAGAAFWGEPEVIVDAARYFTQAKHLEIYGIGYFLAEWGGEIGAWTDLPLVPFLYGLVFSAWGEARGAIQVATTLLFSGTVVLTYLTGRTLWDETVGVYAGALLLGMPYLLTQVPLMLSDIPAMFFLTLAIFATIKALGQGGADWIALSAAAITLAALTKYSTWPLLTVVGIIFLVHGPEEPGRRLRRAGAIVSASLALLGLVVLWKHAVIREQLGLLLSYQAPGLRRWRESFASTFLFQIHPFITAAAALSVVVALAKRDVKYAVISWPLLLVGLGRVERIRYLLVVFPMLALMASYGLREIRGARIRRFAGASIVVTSLVIAVFGYLPHVMRMSAVNVKAAGEHLNALGADTVEVFALLQAGSEVNPAVSVPLLDLFTRKRIVYGQGAGARLGEIETSPLRFTWEYRLPRYYAGEGREGEAVVVIAGSRDDPLPDEVERRLRGYRLSRAFETADEWFQHQTLVRVYERAGTVPAGGPS